MSVTRHPSLLRALAVLVAVLAAAACAAAPAHAGPTRADSAAPPGADPSWLPAESWVMQRWLPFDEPALERIYAMDTGRIAAELDRTGITLNQLAKRRHVPTQGLAGRLLASRHLARGSVLRATLLARTRRMLTQSHLAVHVLSHVFHTWTVTRDTEGIFSVSQDRFKDLYFTQKQTMGAIAAQGGVGTATLRTRALRAAERAGALGVAQGALSARENRLMRQRDRRNFPSWAAYHLPGQAATAKAAAVAPTGPSHPFFCPL
ncbi:hypothetical protein [Baekduia sp.]|jgi:hypothetical protein|uniref:hypothetical protein n=1 Tax=Baekduia sp. TaxID=2600305 RepID=UPI002E066F8A|nr:hypothetical protein [Baekduia sp.]